MAILISEKFNKLKLIRSLFSNINYYLDKNDKKKLILIFFIAILTSCFEIVSIGSVYPLINIFINPSFLGENNLLKNLLEFLGINNLNVKEFFVVIFCILVFIAGILRYLLLVSQSNLSHTIGIKISSKILKNILENDYSFYINNNKNEFITALINKANNIIGGAIYPLQIIVCNIVIVISIFTVMIWSNPLMATSVLVLLILIYVSISIILSSTIDKCGTIVNKEYSNILNELRNTFDSIRDVILNDKQLYFLNKVKKSDQNLKLNLAKIHILSASPRYAIETFGLIIIALAAYFLINNNNNLQFISSLSIMVLCIQKLLPLIHQIYSSYITICGNYENVISSLKLGINENIENQNIVLIKHFYKLEAQNLYFKYLINDNEWVINKLSFHLVKKEILGIYGESGIGKSTLLDIISGLLKPTKGEIFINDKNIICINKKTLHNIISYSHQDVYLINGNIYDNIAFGEDKNSINIDQINFLLKIVDFKLSSNNNYIINETIGDYGVKLSGGQKQKISIARALYKNPELLFLDEATSRLDKETEMKILNNIKENFPNLTIIIISHNYDLLKNFTTKIIEIKK